MKRAIILCSGGLDSVTTAFYVKKIKKYKEITILFFDYGQRNLTVEEKFSRLCAENLGAAFFRVKIDYLATISTSLLNSTKNPKTIQKKDLKNSKNESDTWYVPSRNLIFLSNALSLAESMLIKENIAADIFIGFKNEGIDFYPDTTPEFLKAMNKISVVSTKGKFKIIAPLIKKDKEDVVLLAQKLKVNFRKTYSCYIGEQSHCGTCLACKLRQQGFYWAGLDDPTIYLAS